PHRRLFRSNGPPHFCFRKNPGKNRRPPPLARRPTTRLRRRLGLSSPTTGRGRPRLFPLRSSRRKRSPHHPRRPWPSRFSPPRRQPLLHLARHRPHQQRSPVCRPRSLRPPPRRSSRTPRLPRPRSRLRRRQRTLQTPPLLVGAGLAPPAAVRSFRKSPLTTHSGSDISETE